MNATLAYMTGSALDFTNQSNIHPVGAAVLAVLAILVLSLPRRWAILPMIVLACFVPAGQRVTVATLDFSFLRIIAIFYWIRILIYGEFRGLRFVLMDYLVVAWMIVGGFVFSLQWLTPSVLMNRVGLTYETLGIYFAIRVLVRTYRDIVNLAFVFAFVAVPVAAMFMLEQSTGRNVFSVMGGVPEKTLVREGRLRAQGAFSHPIMAGCFWASVATMLAGILLAKKKRVVSAVGIVACLVIVVCCSSSTPVLAVLAGIGAYTLGYARFTLTPIRIGVPILLVALHFSMQKPVWHLIARISAVGGSTGWHRYHLIDETINHFSEWAVLGTKTTEHWGNGLHDVTNQYILEGVRGGLITMILLIAIVVVGFRSVGKATRKLPRKHPFFWIAWGTGAMLFVHAVNFMGVAYFGQINVVWLLTLSLCATLGSLQVRSAVSQRKPSVRRGQQPAATSDDQAQNDLRPESDPPHVPVLHPTTPSSSSGPSPHPAP